MSVFDGFMPTLTVSSNSVVNLDGYHSLKIENGAAVILDATNFEGAEQHPRVDRTAHF